MGNRYEIRQLKCAYCGHINKNIYYAPTNTVFTFECKKCGKTNFIKEDINFKAIKIEEATYDDVKFAFLNNTNTIWSNEEIEEICKEIYERIKETENVIADYDKKHDILTIAKVNAESTDSWEVLNGGVIIDYDKSGNIVGIEILNISKYLKTKRK